MARCIDDINADDYVIQMAGDSSHSCGVHSVHKCFCSSNPHEISTVLVENHSVSSEPLALLFLT